MLCGLQRGFPVAGAGVRGAPVVGGFPRQRAARPVLGGIECVWGSGFMSLLATPAETL